MDRRQFEEASNRRPSTMAGLLAIWSIGVLDATWPMTSSTRSDGAGWGGGLSWQLLVLTEAATAVAGARRPSSHSTSASPHTWAGAAVRCRR